VAADPLRRVGHLVRIPDWAAAEAALSEAIEALLMRGGRRDIERTLAAFDRDWAQASPVLRRIGAMCAFLRWDWQACADEAAAAARLAQARGDADELARAQAYLAHALYTLDRNDEALALIAELRAREATLSMPARLGLVLADAMQQLRAGNLPRLPAMYAEVLALLEGPQSSDYHWWEGALPINWTTLPGMRALAARYLRGAWARVGDEPLPIAADLHLLEALNHFWAGHLDAARASAARAEEDLRWLAVSGESEVGSCIFRVLEGAVRGEAPAVQAMLQRLLDREREDRGATPARVRLWRHQIAIYGVRASDLLDLGADAIAQWAAMLKENPLADPAPANARAIGTRARFAAAQGRWADAAALFAPLLPRCERLDVMGQAIELQLRAAHAFVRCDRLDEAARAAAPALERIVRDGEQGQALLAGPRVLGELAAAPWGARLAPPLQAALADALALALQARGGVAPTAVSPSAPAATGPASVLSEREREVLAGIAQGQSNKLIARELDISPHTVKRHVANILDKLALASRGQAAAWWRANG
jgi:LuxR family maltose regulon positive regulatory protein